MRQFPRILILIVVLFLHEIQASSGLLRTISTTKDSPHDDEDAMTVSIYGTSRLTTSLSLTHNPTSLGHQALDLHGFQPHILESSHQLNSGGAPGFVRRFKKNKVSTPIGASSTRRIQNEQIQHPDNIPLVTSPDNNSMENSIDLNKPIYIPEESGKKRTKTKTINLNRRASYRTDQEQALYEFKRGPYIQGHPPSEEEATDLFNNYYKDKAHPPSESGEKALELYISHKNLNAQKQMKKRFESRGLYHNHFDFPDYHSHHELSKSSSGGAGSSSEEFLLPK